MTNKKPSHIKKHAVAHTKGTIGKYASTSTLRSFAAGPDDTTHFVTLQLADLRRVRVALSSR